MTWDRVDFARGVILLERTKSGRRREVPMNDAAYAVLSARTGTREGRVFFHAQRPQGLREGRGRGEAGGLQVPRPAAHRGEPPGDARSLAGGRARGPRPRGHQDDHALRPT
jgi:integrase